MKPRNKQLRNCIIFLRCIEFKPDLFSTRLPCQATQIGVNRSLRPRKEGKDWCISSSTSLDQLVMIVKLQSQLITPNHWNGFNPGLLCPAPLTAQAIQATSHASTVSPQNPPVSPFKARIWQKNDPEKKKVYFNFSLSCFLFLFSTATHFYCSENTNYLWEPDLIPVSDTQECSVLTAVTEVGGRGHLERMVWGVLKRAPQNKGHL